MAWWDDVGLQSLLIEVVEQVVQFHVDIKEAKSLKLSASTLNHPAKKMQT